VHRIDDLSLAPTEPKNGDWLFEVGPVLNERLLNFSYA
jgi:hypothetical protein